MHALRYEHGRFEIRPDGEAQFSKGILASHALLKGEAHRQRRHLHANDVSQPCGE